MIVILVHRPEAGSGRFPEDILDPFDGIEVYAILNDDVAKQGMVDGSIADRLSEIGKPKGWTFSIDHRENFTAPEDFALEGV